MNSDEVSFLGLSFSTLNLEQMVSRLTDEYPSHGTAYHLVNAYTLVLAGESTKLQKVLESDFLVCDGKPLAKVLQRRNHLLSQIRGADLMRGTLSNQNGANSHFFLGSTSGTLAKVIEFAEEINPSIKIAGFHSPEYADDFERSIPVWVKMIRESGASVVWVGLGTPKQDYVAHSLADSLPVNAVAIGAAFDFLAGNVNEAPWLVQKIGFEWLFRLVNEPRRLAKRYFLGNYKFIKLILRSRDRGQSSN
jgi:N-acetylglucosaminyldiphosphoundecaprenol N-acetyl-beta-D-mannosaminyltransferase